MPLILALEPNRTQANRLSSVVSGLHADLALVTTIDRVLQALDDRVPDLILIPALLSLTDETSLTDRLRELGPAASHVQTLTIPILAGSTPARSKSGGVLKSLRRGKPRAAVPDGCDPAVFGAQISDYLARAADARLAAEAAARQAAEAAARQAAEAAARQADDIRADDQAIAYGSAGGALSDDVATPYRDFIEPAVAYEEYSPLAESPAAAIQEWPRCAMSGDKPGPDASHPPELEKYGPAYEDRARSEEQPAGFSEPPVYDEPLAASVHAPRSVPLPEEAVALDDQVGECSVVSGEPVTFDEQSATFEEQPTSLDSSLEALEELPQSVAQPADAIAPAGSEETFEECQWQPDGHLPIEMEPAEFHDDIGVEAPPLDTLDDQALALTFQMDALALSGQDLPSVEQPAGFLEHPVSFDDTLGTLEGSLVDFAEPFDVDALAVEVAPIVHETVAFAHHLVNENIDAVKPVALGEPFVFDMPALVVEGSWTDAQQIIAPEPKTIPPYDITITVPSDSAPIESVVAPALDPDDSAAWWIAFPLEDEAVPVLSSTDLGNENGWTLETQLEVVPNNGGAISAELDIPAVALTPTYDLPSDVVEEPPRTKGRRARQAATKPRKAPVPLEVVFVPPEITTVYEDACNTVVVPRAAVAAARHTTEAATATAPADTSRRRGDTTRRKGDTTRRRGATTRRRKPGAPTQDEWGLFDPSKCGFSALLDKLDEVTEPEKSEPEAAVRVRVVTY